MIDQNAAVSAGNIATAMQQVSASAQQAGLDINTTMGYISTIADVSQRDPSSVGASLRTIISRYGTVKAGAFAGMGVDNTGDDLENVNDIEKVLRRLGISIRTQTMEFRALDDVLEDVADRWMEFSSVERNAIATAFAGTRQRESFLILMSNMDKARELTKIAADSQGAAELKYQAYMDSAEAATKRLQNAWEGLTNSFRTSDFLRKIKNGVAWLIENFSTLASTIATILVSIKTMRSMNLFSNKGANIFSAAGSYVKGKVTNAWGTVSSYMHADKSLPGLLQGYKSILTVISQDVAAIKNHETTRMTSVTTGPSTSNGKPQVAITSLWNGTKMVQRKPGETITKRAGEKYWYASPLGKARQKYAFSKQDTAEILEYQGYTTAQTIGGRTFVRGNDGQWYKVKAGGQVGHRLHGTGRSINMYNKQYMDAQYNLKAAQNRDIDQMLKNQAFKVGGKNAKYTSAMMGDDGKWHYVDENGNMTNRLVGQAKVGNLNKQMKNARTDAEAQRALDIANAQSAMDDAKAGRRQEARQRAAAAAVTGIMAGATAGLTTSMTLKNSDGEMASRDARIAAGVTSAAVTGITTGLISAIPYVGPILGPTLGPVIGEVMNKFVAPALGNLIDQQAISRRERSKEAEKTYSVLKTINGDTAKLKELSQKTSWTWEDYTEANSKVDNIIKQMYGNANAARALASTMLEGDLSNMGDAAIVAELSQKFKNEYLSTSADAATRQKLINQWEQTLAREMASQYEASQENNIYNYNKIMNNAMVRGSGAKNLIDKFISETGAAITRKGNKVYFSGDIDERSKVEKELLNYLEDQGAESTGFYKALQKSIAELTSAVGELSEVAENITQERMTAAGITSGLSNLSTTELKSLGKDELARRFLESLNNEGGIYVNSSLTNYKAGWSGSYDTLGATAKNYITDYFRSNSKLWGVFTQESYTLKDVLQRGVLGDLDSTEALNFLTKFSSNLGTTIDKLSDYIDEYGDFSLGDLLLGSDDILSKLDSLNGLLSQMVSSTGLTAQNMVEIISKYPQYIKYMGDTSALAAAIASDTKAWMDLQKEQFATLIESSTTVYDNVLKYVQDTYKTADSEFYTWFIKSENFGEISDLGTFYDKYFSLPEDKQRDYADQFNQIQEQILNEYGSFEANFSSQYEQITRDFTSKLFDLQIKNLEEQKTSLEQINSQREYENKLVEARIKLENAQNEKTAVYREGVGFVYEADQEAIDSAQQELEELENQRLIDTLDMAITELQSQKQWLDDWSDRNQFKEMSQAVQGLTAPDGILSQLNGSQKSLMEVTQELALVYAEANNIDLTTGGGTLAERARKRQEEKRDLQDQTLQEAGQQVVKNRELYNLAEAAGKGDTDSLKTLMQKDESFKKAYEAAGGNKYKQQKALANYTRSISDQYNASVDNFQTQYANALNMGITESTLSDTSHTIGEGDSAISLSDLQSGMGEGGQYSRISDQLSVSGRPHISAGNTEMAKEDLILGVVDALKEGGWNKYVWGATINRPIGKINGKMQYEDAYVYFALDTQDPTKAEEAITRIINSQDAFTVYGTPTVTKVWETPMLANSNGGASTESNSYGLIADYLTNQFGYYVDPGDLARNKKSYFGSYFNNAVRPTLANFYPDTPPTVYERLMFDNGTDGYLHVSDIVRYRQLIGDLVDKINYGSPLFYNDDEGKAAQDRYAQEVYGNAGTDLNSIHNAGLNALINRENFIDEVLKNAQSNAQGSIFTQAGLSSISEVGPELFATPGLSGTALIPEGSKVIPAEATKGLWQFGNLAAQFIKPLQSMSGTSNTNNSMFSTDESTNIQTLNLTLRADKDFDINEFIQQLKALKAISKHN